ncbi:MAG: hypothetical protein ACRDYB_16210 [Acidimicrobiales bacterium]
MMVDATTTDIPQPPLPIHWASTVARLVEQGWAFIPAALDPVLLRRLDTDNRREWWPIADESVARQYGESAFLPFAVADEAVRVLGRQLVHGLSEAARHQGLPPVPDFTEVTWGRYPQAKGRVTAHRDPVSWRGVVAITTLRGAATFRVLGRGRRVREWEVAAGALVLLRGAGWPGSKDRGPVHEVDPPSVGERVTLTLRTSKGGS